MNNTAPSYKKITLANFLSRLGFKLFIWGRAFCAKLIYAAIAMDPNRALFKKNLKYMGLPYNKNASPKQLQKKQLPFYGFSEGCKRLSQKIEFFNDAQTLSLSLPNVINPDFHVSPEYQCETTIPSNYLAELKDATVFSNTDLVIINETILYDEHTRHTEHHYAIKSPVVKKIHAETLEIKIPRTAHSLIETGIHFSKDHSINYFHWIIECLPRLSLTQHLDKTIPLLVDDDLSPQSYEALQVFNTVQRPIIKLQRNQGYPVKKLFYPSPLSIIHDNYEHPRYGVEFAYSPKALEFVRAEVFQKLNINAQQAWRKIFISRKNSHYRQLLNTTEIEDYLLTQGFEIVFPENLSFHAQVQLFSQAKMVIGQSGAGMANIVFAPKSCKVLMMYNDAPFNNLHLFGALATSLGIELEFLIGKMSVKIPHIPPLHTDFTVDIHLLKNYLEQHA